MKISSRDKSIDEQVGDSIRDLNQHGANIYVSEVSVDHKYITIQDLDTREIYYEGDCITWIAIYNILGVRHIIQRIT